ncbi:MAG: hypothetical protein Q8M76_12355, partial [Spirochaetaceae bacterium]|nr:hypothetical protein [Spirochaetaceae bacterium]
VLSTAFGRLEIDVDRSSGFTWKERTVGKGTVKRWPLSDLDRISIEKASVRISGSDAKELVIEAGASKLRLGRSLSERELRAIKDALEAWVARTINIEAPLPNTLPRD